MNCLNCTVPIEQIGNKPKKFCSDKCKTAFYRNNKAIETQNVTPIETHLAGNSDNPVVEPQNNPNDPYPGAAPKPGFAYKTVKVMREGELVLRKKCANPSCDEGIHELTVLCYKCVANGLHVRDFS